VRDLPTGTVTFLFTDIEGSTRLLQELGDAYAHALSEHRRLLRQAFGANAGVEVDTQGDAFFVAFTRATDAISAAAEAQRTLVRGSVRVRMGIHTGEPLVTDEGYAGMDVHRAARIAAAGHGGQVLVSHTTRDLVEDELPTELALRDLGEHRLKDLTRPQRVYQLLAEWLDDDFPPLATLDNCPTNLPPQATPLIGRERELREITATLGRAEVRLLTLTGPGGAGKTRLALQAAADMLDEFRDGAFFVELAPVADGGSVLPTVAQTLGVKGGPGRSLSESVREFLGERRLLLVLDNFEHVVDAASDLIELVLSTLSVKALVASRAPLRVSAEREYPVPQLADADAVALFTERAQAIKPDFQIDGETPAVADICRRLDGLPLAIELAAARAKVLSPSALLERMEQRLPILTGGPRDLPDRQRTLRDTIAWSHDLLDDSEKRAFSRLGVFVGGFSLEAAEEVCAANLDAVGALVEKSLVRQDEGRLVMLETIREYALERLEDSADSREIRQRHAEYFLREAELRGGTGEAVAGRGDVFAWWKRELDNASVAMEWFRESSEEEQELRLIAAAANYWRAAGVFSEYGPLIEDAVQRCSATPPQLRATALSHAAGFAWSRGDYERAEALANECLALSRPIDYRDGLVHGLMNLAIVKQHTDREDEARAHYREAQELTADASTPTHWRAILLNNLGNAALEHHDYDEARALFNEALELNRRNDLPFAVANCLVDLGMVDLAEHDLVHAADRFGECLSISHPYGFWELVSWAFEGIAGLAVAADDARWGAQLLGSASAIQERAGIAGGYYPVAAELRERTIDEARRLLGEAGYEASWLEGRELDPEQAIAVARRVLD